MKKYNETLLMPNTKFPMKGNLTVKEIEIQNFWDTENIYEECYKKNINNVSFNLHDGPPFANGNIHVGHALNKILKDFINREKTLQGHKVKFITGWDTHGLPIEHVVIKKYGKKILEDKIKFRKICKDYVLKQVEIQLSEFKRLGIFTNWDNKYLTLYPEYESCQLQIFSKMLEKNLVKKGKKIIAYSPSSRSALAEAEIEYKNIKSKSIYVKFISKEKFYNNKNVNIIIWTTTPWTLLANTAISLGENYVYLLLEYDNELYLISEELLESLKIKFSWDKDLQIIKKYNAKELEGIIFHNPIIERDSILILGNHVTLDMGTGAVHTAPAYGEDDFNIGNKYNLPLITITDEKGFIINTNEKFDGQFYKDIVDKVIQELINSRKLVLCEEYEHSYPHDWRTKEPIIYWATEQWFIEVSKFKDKTINIIKNDINFLFNWSKKRLLNMIENRDNWCISRQRIWGVPIPIFYDENNEPIMDHKLVDHVSKLFKQYGTDIWYEWQAKDLLPENYTNVNCPNNKFKKEQDIMDVWLDSGTSYNYVSKKFDCNIPFDLYFEGSDQYRGWFNSSLITSVIFNDKSPYKQLISAGFVVDKNGRKMSKSLGNVISPQKIVNQYGADVLRLWVSSTDYSSDIKISEDIIKDISSRYRKIRNTIRFILGNISDFNKEEFHYDQLENIDKYMLQVLKEYRISVQEYYSMYDFSSIYKATINFINNDLSSFYLDYVKDILYCEQQKSIRRRQVQFVIKEILKILMRYLAPIIPHTIEEVWQYFEKKERSKSKSIFLNEFEFLNIPDDTNLIGKWEIIMNIRKEVLKVLEIEREKGSIGKSLDAEITIYLSNKYSNIFEEFTIQELTRLFIVSKVNIILVSDNKLKDSYISNIIAKRCENKMCQRCWNKLEDKNFKTDDLCLRCYNVINCE